MLALVLLAGCAQLPYAAAAIFKCRSANGHWSYADRPQPNCRGGWIVLQPLPAPRRTRPTTPARAARRPSPLARRTAQRRLRHWQATLSALRATRVPRDHTLALWRAEALHIVVADITKLRGALDPQGHPHSP
ncbi:hypothetical protein [Acidiferrobacter sp.]